MKKYLSFFKIRFIAGIQYRAAALAGIVTQLAWGGMTLLMFRAFYQSNASAFPMTFEQLSSYTWMREAFLGMFMTWIFDMEIFDSITSGSIAYQLCRPCDIYNMWFTKNMATRLSNTLLRCVPILLIAVLLPEPFGIMPPPNAVSFALFLVSMLLGFLVLVAFSMLIYISAFFTVSPKGIRILAVSVTELFTGDIIPIPFFPKVLQPFMYAQPFASMQNTPFLIYSGHTDIEQAFSGILLQFVWLAVFLIFGRVLMKQALKKVVVQGG